MNRLKAMTAIAMTLAALSTASAADYPAPKQSEWIAHDFKFHTGEVMPALKLAYTTIGKPAGEPVLVLHGTGGSAAAMLTPAFAGELFGPGQPLDASKYFIIIPDVVGHGKSSKPSAGLKTQFPHYNYADMVDAQHRLLTEHLGIKHLRLVIGNSMGGMETWLWGEKYPGFMDALVPMASQPTAMSSRNWMLRRMMIESIRNDPDCNNGNYTKQPNALKYASIFFSIATSGGTLNYQKQAPTRELADKVVDARLALPVTADANDFLWQWESSADYDAAPGPLAHPGVAAGDQRRGRRTQSTGDGRDGARAERGKEREAVPHPGKRGDQRPSHDRQCQVLQAAASGILADRAAAGDVKRGSSLDPSP
jgi:homoserine O-acetyltransferase